MVNDERSVSETLVEDVEFCNVIVINKYDLLNKKKQKQLNDLLKCLNPSAKILKCNDGKVTLESKFDQVTFTPFYKVDLQGLDFKVVKYQGKRAFHPERLYKCLHEGQWKGLYRSIGMISVANLQKDYEISSCGASFKFSQKEKNSNHQEIYFLVKGIFISLNLELDEQKIWDQLDKCLLKDDELQIKKFKDPFNFEDEIGDIKQQFDKILSGLTDDQKELFTEYVFSKLHKHEDHSKEDEIESIVKYLKTKTSISAEAPDEKLIYPKFGQFKGYTDKNTIHVDSFLYTDEDVEELIKNNKISPSYCKDCFSKNIEELSKILNN